jgi:hypothetical protein
VHRIFWVDSLLVLSFWNDNFQLKHLIMQNRVTDSIMNTETKCTNNNCFYLMQLYRTKSLLRERKSFELDHPVPILADLINRHSVCSVLEDLKLSLVPSWLRRLRLEGCPAWGWSPYGLLRGLLGAVDCCRQIHGLLLPRHPVWVWAQHVPVNK